MREASCKHDSARPFSAALRIHLIAICLLRVKPRRRVIENKHSTEIGA
jgi:hypothetical protein